MKAKPTRVEKALSLGNNAFGIFGVIMAVILGVRTLTHDEPPPIQVVTPAALAEVVNQLSTTTTVRAPSPSSTAATSTRSGSTSTTVARTSSTTISAEQAQQVVQFRSILSSHGLTSNELSDADVISFGSTFCVYARASLTPDDFATIRNQAITDSNSSLDKESLALVINAAVVVFCPAEATRLGVKV